MNAGRRVLGGNARFGGLNGVGIVDVIVPVIARALKLNELGANLRARERRIRLRK